MSYTQTRDEILAVERRFKETGEFTPNDARRLVELGVPFRKICLAVDYNKLQAQLTKHFILMMEE